MFLKNLLVQVPQPRKNPIAKLRRRFHAILIVSCLVVGLSLSAPAFANSCQSNVTTGNWSASGSWTSCGGTTPQTTDTIQILNGHTITIDGSARTVAGVQIDNGGVLANGGFLLSDTGVGVGINGFTVNGTLSGTGGVTISGLAQVIDGSGTVSATGTFTISNSVSFASTANLTIAGTVAISGAVTVTNNGTVTTTGTGGITGTVAGSTWTQGVNATLNFRGNTTSLLATGTLNAINAGNTVNYNQNGAQTCKVTQYYHLTLSNGGAKTCAITATVLGNLLTSGSAGATTWTLSSAFIVTGTFTVDTGSTVTTSTNAFTVTSTTSVNGSLVLTGATSNKTFTGLLTVNSGGSLTGASTTIVFRNGLTNSGGTVSITGTATFNTNAQALTGTMSIARVSVTTVTLTNNGTLTISTSLAGTGGLTNASTGTVNYNVTTTAPAITTLTATAVGNTFNYGGAAQTCKVVVYHHLNLLGSGAKSCGIATINGDFSLSGTATWTMTTAVAVGGDVTVNGGTLTTGGVLFTVSGETNINGGTLSITNNTAAKTFVGLVTVAGGTLSGASTQGVFRGGITRTTGSVSITGTATFNTNAQALNGVMSIATVSVTSVTLTNYGTLTISTSLTGTGGFTNETTGTVNYNVTTTAPAITTLTATAVGNTFNYGGAAQTCKVVSYYNLSLSTSGTKTCAVTTVLGDLTTSGTLSWTHTSAVAISGDLTVGSGTTVATAGFIFSVDGTTNISGTLQLQNNTGTKTLTGLITVNLGGTLNGGSNNVIWKAGLVNNGTVNVTGVTMDTASGVVTANTNVTFSTLAVTAADQVFSGAGTISMSTLTVTSPGTVTNNGTVIISSTLSGTGSFTNGESSTLTMTSSAPTITTLDATPTENTVNYTTINPSCKTTTYYHLNFTNSGNVTCATTSVLGNVGLSGTVSWTTTSTIAVGGNLTVGSGTTLTTGASQGLSVTGTTSVTGTLANANTASKTYTGAVTINSGGSWTNASNSSITFKGGFTNNSSGTVNFGTTATITFDTNSQAIGGTNSITIPSVVVTGVTVTNNGTLTVNISLSGTGELTQGAGDALTLNGTTSISTLTASATGNTVVFSSNSAGQTIPSTTYYFLSIIKSGQVATLGGAIIVLGDLNISAGTLDTASGSSYPITLAGNYTNSGTFTARSSVFTLNGSSAQTLSGTMTGGSAFGTLVLSNTSGVDDPACGTSFTPGIIFAASATATNYTITTGSVRVQYLSGGTYTFTNINWNGGDVATPIFFRNSALGSGTWILDVSGTQTAVSYVNVGRSDASGGSAIAASDGTNTDCLNNTNWNFTSGTLSVDIVNGSGVSVLSPSVVMSVLTFSFTYQTSTGTLGTSAQKIRVTNTTSYAPWTLTVAATSGATALWTGALSSYDFNDATANAVDGGDADSVGGQLILQPNLATITPQGGCSSTGLSLGSQAGFVQGITNSVTLLTASSGAQTNCYWDITGIGLSQTVPAEQAAGSDYVLDITLTATAS